MYIFYFMNFLNNNFNISFVGLYPELYLLFSILFLISFLVILDKLFKYRFLLMKLAGYLFIFVLLETLILNNSLLVSNFSIFYNSLIIDKFIVISKDILLCLLIIVVLVSFSYVSYEKIHFYELYLLLSIVIFGLFTIISANDLLVMYIGIETLSLSFYILATLKIYNNFSTEAGLKYFILGAFSSGLLLYGSSLIYGSTGSINFSDINLLFNNNFLNKNFEFDSLIIGSIFVILAIFFKLGAAPFHMWIPDVYEGAPTIVTMVFSIVPKLAIFVLFFHFNINFFYLNSFFLEELLFYVAFLSIFIGTLGALYQIKIKRLLAYSAISHMGFLLIGFSSFTNSSIFSLFFYLVVYIIISINIFTVVLVLRKHNNLKIKKINELVVLFKSNPILAINLSLILFSIAGIPPLVGFYSKLYIFIFALKSQMYLIVILAAVLSVIGSLYYIRLVKLMFFKNFEYWVLFKNISKVESLLISITLLFNILFFCFPEVLVLNLYNVILQIFY